MRMIAVALVLVLLSGAVPPALSAGQAHLEICHGARWDGRRWVGEDCGEKIYQQTPWVVYLASGVEHVRGWVALEDHADPERTRPGSRIVSQLRGFPTAVFYTVFVARPWEAGQRYVVLLRLDDRSALAQAQYSIIAQSPQEAVAAWEGQTGWRVFGLVTALMRLGEHERAERTLQRLASVPRREDWHTWYYSRLKLLEMYESRQRVDDAIRVAREMVAENGQGGDHVLLVGLLLRLCRLDEARAATVAALRTYPGDPQVRDLARQLVEAGERCNK